MHSNPIPDEAGAPVAPQGEPLPHPVRRARKQGRGPRGLELCFCWGDQRVGEYFLEPGRNRAFTVGSAPSVDFAMGDARLGGPRFEVVRAGGEGFDLRFTRRMRGLLTRGDETLDLRQLIERGLAEPEGEAFSLHLESDDFVSVDLGGVRVESSFQPVPKRSAVALGESLDFTAINIFLAVFSLAALFVITAANRELEGEDLADELAGTEARIAKLIIQPRDVRENPLLEKLAQPQEERGQLAARRRGEGGQSGQRDAPERSARAAPTGDPSNEDQARTLTQRIFGGGSGLSTVFGTGGLGGELKRAMGNLIGSAPGDARGFSGLGLRGTGAGGDGDRDTIGIGAIDTKGRGGGLDDYGARPGAIGGKKALVPSIPPSDIEVGGPLDKELIRQVIARNRLQIRFCYESQLTRSPELAGKVRVKFIISGSGAVVQSTVVEDTADNGELGRCVAGRVHTRTFPKPKNGSAVAVSYPFIFKQAGE